MNEKTYEINYDTCALCGIINDLYEGDSPEENGKTYGEIAYDALDNAEKSLIALFVTGCNWSSSPHDNASRQDFHEALKEFLAVMGEKTK